MNRRFEKLLGKLMLLVLIVSLLPICSISAAERKPVLNAETQCEIQEAYLDLFKTENPDSVNVQKMTADDIEIIGYYGLYNGYHIMQIYFKDWSMRFDEVVIKIGGYEFITNSSLASYFYAYKDGMFTHVRDAYAEDLLRDEDMFEIAVAYGAIEPWECPFIDVKSTDWYYESVGFVYENKLFSGLTEDTFAPDMEMTRAMLATVLWRYAGSPTGGVNIFEDVPEGTWYTDAVAWAAKQGLVYGISEGIYSPEDKITREQLAAIFYRYAKKVNAKYLDVFGNLEPYTDAEKISDWAYESVSWATGRILSGRDLEGILYIAPDGNATRAEVASMLIRFNVYLE